MSRSCRVVLGISGCLAACALGPAGAAATSSGFGVKDGFALAPAVTAPGRAPPFPGDIAVGPDGAIYVINGAEVQKYSPHGELLRHWGTYGSGPGQFGGSFEYGSAGEIAVGGGQVYVSDVGGDRIQRFTEDGAYLGSVPRSGAPAGEEPGPGFPSLAADPAGNVFVSDARGLRKLSPSGALLANRPGFDRGAVAFGWGSLFLQANGVIVRHDAGDLSDPDVAFAVLHVRAGHNSFTGGGDLSVAHKGVWVNFHGVLVLLDHRGMARQVCRRGVLGGPPAAIGRDVYTLSRKRVTRFGPGAKDKDNCDLLPPVLRHVHLSKRRILRTRSTTFTFSLSKPARVRVAWLRLSGHRVRNGSVTFHGHSGRNRRRLRPVIRRHALRPGRYLVRLSARDAENNRSRVFSSLIRVVGAR
jgi:hypothetical protein